MALGYKQKKIAVINDLSGYGRCSLTVAIPILSALRLQCCPVPTSILSNHTGFSTYYFDDYTDEMRPYIEHWKKLNLEFDGICSGFLGSADQIDIVIDMICSFRGKETKVIVDPIMGDNGKAYATFTPELCRCMKKLAAYGDVVTPNVTEACILTDTEYKKTGWKRAELADMAKKLQMLGPSCVVITGVNEGRYLTNVVLDRDEAPMFQRSCKVGQERCGTGDVFSSIVAGETVKGKSLQEATRLAASFVKRCILKSDEIGIPKENGVCFEEELAWLIRRS